jgi:hypothetical protein
MRLSLDLCMVACLMVAFSLLAIEFHHSITAVICHFGRFTHDGGSWGPCLGLRVTSLKKSAIRRERGEG